MSARVHEQPAQRAATSDRKVVFKSVLDNPFKISWPHVPLNLQNTALASLVTILDGVGEHHAARQTASRKRKRAKHDKARKEKVNARKKRKVGDEGTGVEVTNAEAEDAAMAAEDSTKADSLQMNVDAEADVDDELPTAPPIVSHLTFGINEVTKRLESQAQSRRLRTSIRVSTTSDSTEESVVVPVREPACLTHVFVCRADVDPPILIAHLPELVAACNIPSPSLSQHRTPVQLIPLPKHAEQTLADAVGLRRVSVIALDSMTPSLTALSSLLASVQPPTAPWLTAPTSAPSTSHIPTHIKQLRTTAPRDMRAAKRARTDGRQAAKERHKDKAKQRRQDNDKRNSTPRKEGKGNKRIRVVAPAPAPSEDLLPT